MLTNVTIGNSYTWETCTSTAFNTQLTLYRDGTSTLLAFNNDFCGLQSRVDWTATFTGNVRVLLDQMPGCTHNSTHHAIRVILNGILDGEVLSLAVFEQDENVRLEWILPENSMASRIVVEQSTDGDAFREIAILDADGSGKLPAFWVDQSPLHQQAWYRIQVHDLNGQITFSDPQEVGKMGESDMRIWPNPSAGRMRLEWVGGEGPMDVTIWDMQGRQVQHLTEEVSAGLWQKHIDISSAGHGSYWIVAKRGNFIRRELVVVTEE